MGGGRGHSTPTPTSSSPQFQEVGRGSLCNQAIMLITDGAVEDYEPVFQKYNWPDRKVPPGRGQGGGEGKGVPPPTAEGCSPPLYPMRPRTCSKIRVTPEAPCEGMECGGDGKLLVCEPPYQRHPQALPDERRCQSADQKWAPRGLDSAESAMSCPPGPGLHLSDREGSEFC